MTLGYVSRPAKFESEIKLPSYAPLAIANSFIGRHADSHGIEHMKLQKLVYFTHGWWLPFSEEPLVNEKPQVWRHGPVFDSLYHVLKPFGHQPIMTQQSRYPGEVPIDIEGDNQAPAYIDFVWSRYGHLSSFALSDMTHRAGTPWSLLAKEYNYKVPLGLEIPDAYVRQEFKMIYEKEFASVGQTEKQAK